MTYMKFLLTRYWYALAFLIIFTVAAFFLKDFGFSSFVAVVWAVYLAESWQHYKKCKDNGYF